MGAMGTLGLVVLVLIAGACVLSLPYTLGQSAAGGPRYDEQIKEARLMPPLWSVHTPEERAALSAAGLARALQSEADARGQSAEEISRAGYMPSAEQIEEARPRFWLGADLLGRDLLVRCLAGGSISLGVGLAAALISVIVGTLYGSIAGWMGGRIDALMMRVVDVLYGLPYVLLVVLLAVAGDAIVERRLAAGIGSGAEVSASERAALGLLTLLVAIGGVSWLTMARVIRGQVLAIKALPFVEASRAIGTPGWRVFLWHLLPNLVGPIVVYATLTVPQAILQESFLSFLGIGVRPPMPSWGNLTAEGLSILNPVRMRWWLLLPPCLLLSLTLVALNFVGEGLRAWLDPRSNTPKARVGESEGSRA